MKQGAVLFLFCLLGLSGLANAQSQPDYSGAFAASPPPGRRAAAVTPTPTRPPSPGIARPPTPQTAGANPQEQLRIVADPSTNSLIIFGTAQEFQNVRNILKELDAIPRQVLIEALILQIDLKDSEDFGIDYEILRRSRTTIFGGTFTSRGALTTLGKLFPAASAFSGVGGLSGIVGDDTVSAMIRAAATDSRVKIISAPSVLATDNHPARLQVGSEEPIATSSTSQSDTTLTGAGVTTNQIQYRNTGRILTIIPQVNAQGLVNLQIKAEVSARGDDVTIGRDSFPAFNTQDAETTAVVHDGETLVIGGLIGERKSKGRSGIPYLMDLPFLGRFFGTTNDLTERNELIMLITPRVIRNRAESREVTEEFKSKLSSVRNELERMQRDRERDIKKIKSLRRDPPTPAVPMPPAVEPQPPPPVTAPARPGAYFRPFDPYVAPAAPLVESAVSSEHVPPAAETQGDLNVALVAIDADIESAKDENPVGAAQVPGTSSEKIETPSVARVQTDKSVALAVPMPPAVEPQPPPPVTAPARPGAYFRPFDPYVAPTAPLIESTVSSEHVPPAAEAQGDLNVALVAIDADIESAEGENPVGAAQAPGTPSERIETPSVARLQTDKSVALPTKVTQVWVVQVASFAQAKDADLLAQKLRDKGYDARVIVADVDGKTWHRVQVGELASQQEAFDLQKSLKSSEKLEQAFVALR